MTASLSYLRMRLKMAELFAVSMPKDRAVCRERKSISWLHLQKIMVQRDWHTLQFRKMVQSKSSFAKFMTDEQMKALIDAMGGENGDLLLFAADKNKVVWAVLGALRLELAAQMDLLDKNEYKFLWVTEFPLLEWNDEQNRFTAMHHPFTMPMEEDLQYIDSDPGRVRAKAYDIVLNGNEIGGGSVRIFNPEIQSKMFEVLGFTPEQAQEQFGFLLTAFKYGVPPHAGLAYGLDRLVMLMAKEDSIRDVIAFPKVKDASDLMTEAPTRVAQEQLDELGLAITAETEE